VSGQGQRLVGVLHQTAGLLESGVDVVLDELDFQVGQRVRRGDDVAQIGALFQLGHGPPANGVTFLDDRVAHGQQVVGVEDRPTGLFGEPLAVVRQGLVQLVQQGGQPWADQQRLLIAVAELGAQQQIVEQVETGVAVEGDGLGVGIELEDVGHGSSARACMNRL
jgi:hypothetical protein